jgi:hypothetical protein
MKIILNRNNQETVKKWEVYKFSKNLFVIKIYFKILKDITLETLLKIVDSHKGSIRMFPTVDNFIEVDIFIKQKHMVQRSRKYLSI